MNKKKLIVVLPKFVSNNFRLLLFILTKHKSLIHLLGYQVVIKLHPSTNFLVVLSLMFSFPLLFLHFRRRVLRSCEVQNSVLFTYKSMFIHNYRNHFSKLVLFDLFTSRTILEQETDFGLDLVDAVHCNCEDLQAFEQRSNFEEFLIGL